MTHVEEPDAGIARVVDARGLACPRPVIDLAAAVDEVDVGDVVELWADDPAARVDVPVWCRMRRQQLTAVDDVDGALRFHVRRRT
jgi:tRNA 2-thiouridine synthesizing protein A